MLSMASSSSLSRSWLYHVFVSFRGVDVRKGFLSHVLKGLESKGIIAFIDDEMKRGQSIDAELIGAIRQSRVAIVLLSLNYASSSWCLDELVEIMKCRKEDQQTVMTIFYKVDPSHVRKQTGDFGKVFEETCLGNTEEVRQAWRQALSEVAGIAGYHSSNCGNEADLINKVASDVLDVLGFTPSKDFDDFVGIRARITDIKSKLILQSEEEVKVIVVAGPAGIGKTTTARVLYNQLSPGFPFSTFLEDIRGNYEKPCGNDYLLKLRLQKKLLSQIFNQKDIEVRHLGVAQEKLRDKKVLVVFDEVDSWWQLEEMAKQRGWFGPESIVIITTEDRKLLKALRLGIDHIYDMKFPTRDESLQILCQYAFGQNSPYDGFEELAWEVTWLAGDLPLGLKVMGSYLRGMSRDEWIEALPRLRSSLDREIESTLRFSYDGLCDKDQALFLHIACFFTGLIADSIFSYNVDYVKKFLANCRLEVNHGLQVLADKSLIFIDMGWVKMHNLLQQMGREIVKKQSLEEPGKRQFLWDASEITDVLEENTGTGKVISISLIISKSEEITISKSAFDGMNNLQFLKVDSINVCIPEGLDCLPDKLRVIDWHRCPLTFWPSKFSGKFLVHLYMPRNKFEKLWEGVQPLPCLNLMDLSFSEYLKKIPDLSKATSLEELNLNGCKSLLELTSSIGNATKLRVCKLKGCLLLKELPSSMGRLINLEVLKLDLDYSTIALSSTIIKGFPNVPDSIVELDLCRTGIENLLSLRKLVMYGCEKLKSMSPNISKLENLEFLGLSFHDLSVPDAEDEDEIGNLGMDTDFFEAIIEWGPDLKKRSLNLISDFNIDDILPICLPEKALTSPVSVSLRGDYIKTIPDWIRSLTGLSKLDITECNRLIALPPLPGSLLTINAESCGSLEIIDSSSFKNPKICLDFANCYNLNQEAKKLIQTSACKYAVLPCEEVPAHFPHQASSDSLTINMTPTPLPSSLRFKACIFLTKDKINLEDHNDDDEDEHLLMDISCLVMGKQDGLTVPYASDQLNHMPDLYTYEKHLYIFEDSFSLNQDCPEDEEATFNELFFKFRVHDERWKVEGCGVQLLEEVPQCILDGKETEEDECIGHKHRGKQ